MVFAKQCLRDLRKETTEIQEKVLILADALRKGAVLSMPVSRDLVGQRGLKELRIKDEKGIVRVFYYIVKKDRTYMLHLFRKKSRNTPKKEIETALHRLKNVRS